MSLRRRTALALLNLGAALMVLGGIGDVLVTAPPAAWDRVVGVPLASLPSGVSHLLLAMLAVLGSALIACGVATLFLVNGPLRRGERWSTIVILLLVILSEGSNALTMARLGVAYFWAPLSFVALVLVGLALAHMPTPVFRPRTAQVQDDTTRAL